MMMAVNLLLQTGLTVFVCVVLLCCAATLVNASPLYLLRERAGQTFTYEARRNLLSDYEAMLPNSSYNYIYSFTEDMNIFIKALFASTTMSTIIAAVGDTFENCVVRTDNGPFVQRYSLAGCFKTLLHAGIAGDCVATNPLCCVLYWRYPATLADNLTLSEIDPRLIFWDGTTTVNGFFTNFSDTYRKTFADCSTLSTWPVGNTVSDGAALSVDSQGEWRFTRRREPAASFVEHRIDLPTTSQSAEFNVLSAAGDDAWASLHQFGDIPLVAPIVVSAALLLACFVLLILGYCCMERSSKLTQAALQQHMMELEDATAAQEEEIEQRRRAASKSATARRTSSTNASARQSPGGSFAQPPKVSPSPVVFHRSPSAPSPQPSQLNLLTQRNGSMGMSTSRSPSALPLNNSRAFPTPSRPPSGTTSPAVLSRQNSQPQLQRVNSGTGRRASITPEQRRPPSRQNSQPQLQRTGSNLSNRVDALPRQLSRRNSQLQQLVVPRTGSNLSRNANSIVGARSNSLQSAARRSPQSFENPLLGRQTFK